MGVSMTMVAIGTPTSVEPSVTTPGHAQIRTQVIAGCRGTARFRRHGLQLEVLGVAAKFRETSWNFRQATAGPCQFRHLVTVFPQKNQPFRSYTSYTPISATALDKAQLKKNGHQSIIPLVDWLATVASASQHCQPLLFLPKSQSQITHQRKLELPLYGYAAMFSWEIWCII